jgi:hypothetical protein
VRQHELLMAADEVMMEVAYALMYHKFRLLGVAGTEFVIEAPQSRADEMKEHVQDVAHFATVDILGEFIAPVTIELTDRW